MTALTSTSTLPLRRLPPLPGPGADALTPGQRRAAVGAIVALHVAGVWGLLQVGEVREAAREAMPMFVDLIAPTAPPAPPTPTPPTPPAPKQALPQRAPTPPPRLVAAAPSPAPAAFVAPAPLPAEEAPAPVAAAPAPVVVAPPAPPAPPPAAAPRTIAPSDVQYLVEPALEYPRASVRNRESGRVVLLVLINETGLPSEVQVARSSGFKRLDDAAVTTVAKARFRPPTVNGQPVSGWASIPIDFALEK